MFRRNPLYFREVVEIVATVAHGDCDGLISTTLVLRKLGNSRVRIYFSSPPYLRDTILRSIIGRKADEIYIADLSPNRESLIASSIYSRAHWFDHHAVAIDNLKVPDNVSLHLNPEAESAAKVVAEHFGIKDRIVDIANQIDRNAVEDTEAEQLRSLVGYLKKYTQGLEFALRMRNLAIKIAEKGLDYVLSQQEYLEAIGKYELYLRELSRELFEKIRVFDLNGYRVAIYITEEFNPIYYITNKLKEHEKAPFDYIAVVVLRKDKGITKLEFRTHTGRDVLTLARHFGGGGHRVASGATVQRIVTEEEILNAIQRLF